MSVKTIVKEKVTDITYIQPPKYCGGQVLWRTVVRCITGDEFLMLLVVVLIMVCWC
jgi:hypothetical protein